MLYWAVLLVSPQTRNPKENVLLKSWNEIYSMSLGNLIISHHGQECLETYNALSLLCGKCYQMAPIPLSRCNVNGGKPFCEQMAFERSLIFEVSHPLCQEREPRSPRWPRSRRITGQTPPKTAISIKTPPPFSRGKLSERVTTPQHWGDAAVSLTSHYSTEMLTMRATLLPSPVQFNSTLFV